MIADFYFRALCAELTDSLNRLHSVVWAEAPQLLNEDSGEELDLAVEDALTSARAALAAPEQGPSPQCVADGCLEEAARQEPGSPMQQLLSEAGGLLARWGRPAVELVPVPVAERLPGPEDCDDQGRCWWLARLPFPFTHWLPHWAFPVPQEGADG